jgi:phosphatidylserine/phosphatidylglycerophosphate/cardiolipin synthase-like enzyme
MNVRQIHKTSSRARNEARELLEQVFASELLRPSRVLWIVSPWIRDVPILDNRAGAYSSLGPEFPRVHVRLSAVLKELGRRGTSLVMACRPGPEGGELGDEVQRDLDPASVTIRRLSNLHVKGIVGDAYALTGSMNLTHNGVDHLTELIQFVTDPVQVASLRSEFRQHYGDGGR